MRSLLSQRHLLLTNLPQRLLTECSSGFSLNVRQEQQQQLLQAVTPGARPRYSDMEKNRVARLLQLLQEQFDINQQYNNRHNFKFFPHDPEKRQVLFDFAQQIHFFGKPSGYKFAQYTLDGVLPSEDTLLADHVRRHSPLLNEPGFTLDRFTRLRQFFQQLGYQLPLFHLANDATVLRQQLTWRPTDNTVHGLITLRDVRCPDSIAGITQLVEQYGSIDCFGG
jgi:hypothetical protein